MRVIDYKLFTKQQERIHKGLMDIGHSLADFYEDAIRVAHPSCTLKAKSNLIGHLAREIDSGIRSVFGPENVKAQMQQLFVKEKKEEKNEEPKEHGEKCKCEKPKDERGNFASILAAVGKPDPNNELAKEWLKISKKLHKFAHRRPAHTATRDPKEAFEIWARYEQVLSIFLGSFYAMLQRLDTFLEMNDPPMESLPALRNILANERQAAYFFGKLQKPVWLKALKDEKYFAVENAPAKTEENEQLSDWIALRTLPGLALLNIPELDAEIKAIIDPIMIAYINDKIELHPYSIADISKALINMNTVGFGKLEHDFFQKVSSGDTNATLFYGLTITEDLPGKLLAQKDKDSLLHFLNYVFGFTTYEVPGFSFFDLPVTPSTGIKPNLDTMQIRAMMERSGKAFMEFIGKELIEIVTSSIKRVESIENRQNCAFPLASIEDTDQTQYSDDWDHILTRTLRDYASLLSPEVLSGFIDEWLYSEHKVLQRLAVHLIRKNFDTQQKNWWKFIETDTNGLFIHEPYLLIKEASPGYTAEQFDKTIDWIEKSTKVEQWEGHTEEYAISHRSYKVRKWLSAFALTEPVSIEKLKQIVQEYDAKNDWQFEHPEYDGYSTIRIGPDIPVKPEEFIELDIDAQLKFMQEFVAPAHEPTAYRGLAMVLESNCAKNPEKYLFELDKFLNTHTVYLQGLIKGFSHAVRNKEIDSYSPVLQFIRKKISAPGFDQEEDKEHRDKEGFIREVENYFSTLVQRKDLLISKEDIVDMIEIIISILNNPGFHDNTDKIFNGYITHVMNSLQGRLLTAMLDLCQLYAEKFMQQDDPVKWPEVARNYFSNNLNRTGNAAKDLSIVLGSRLLLFYYLDKNWVMELFDAIFNTQDAQQYEYTFATAINSYYNPDHAVYQLLSEHGFFEQALDRYPDSTGTLRQVMTYGIQEWQFWGIPPDGDKGIINGIIKRANPSHFKELIDVIFRVKYLSYPLIKILWRKMLDAAKANPGIKELSANMLWLAELSGKIDDETVALSLETIDNIDKGSKDVYSFTRHIYQHADSNLEKAAQIVQTLFEKGITQPYYDIEPKKFVRKLFESGRKDSANEICKLVADMQSFALQDIYNEFNK